MKDRHFSSGFGTVLEQLRANLLLRNTACMLFTQGSRAVVQAVYFVAIARALGPEGYGAFIAVAALAGVAAPFASWGGGDLIVQSVARDPDRFPRAWGSAIAAVFFVGSLLIGVFGLAAISVLPSSIPFALVLLVSAAEFWFAPLVNVGAQTYQAFERLARTGQIWLTLSLARLLAATCLTTLFEAPTPLQWAVLYLASTILAAGLVITLVTKELGRPNLDFRYMRAVASQGFFFSVTLSAGGISNDIDKTMLAKLSTLGIAGVYAAAYRVVELAFVPITSLLFASYARFFRHGTKSISFAAAYSKRLLLPSLGYSLLAGLALWLTSPLLPHLLGSDYQGSSAVMRWLAPLPLLRTVTYFGAHALTGSGYQPARGAAQLLAAGLNVALNAWLIPVYSWLGAVWATLASDAALALGLWVTVLHFVSVERRDATAKAEPGIGLA